MVASVFNTGGIERDYDSDFEEFDTDLGGADGFGDVGEFDATEAAMDAVIKTPMIQPIIQTTPSQTNNNDAKGPAIQQNFQFATGQNSFKAMDNHNTDKVAKGVRNDQQTAATMQSSGKEALASMKQQAQDMTREAGGQDAPSGPDAGGTNLGKIGVNAGIDTAMIAGIAKFSPEAAAVAAVVSVGSDVYKIAQATLTGKGSDATMGGGDDLAKSARSMSSKTGYVDQGFSGGSSAPSTVENTFAKLSHGPGFGKAPSMDDIDDASGSISGMDLNITEAAMRNSPAYTEAMNTLHAGTETLANTTLMIEEGFAPTMDNLADAGEINAEYATPEFENPFEIKPERVFV